MCLVRYAGVDLAVYSSLKDYYVKTRKNKEPGVLTLLGGACGRFSTCTPKKIRFCVNRNGRHIFDRSASVFLSPPACAHTAASAGHTRCHDELQRHVRLCAASPQEGWLLWFLSRSATQLLVREKSTAACTVLTNLPHFV